MLWLCRARAVRAGLALTALSVAALPAWAQGTGPRQLFPQPPPIAAPPRAEPALPRAQPLPAPEAEPAPSQQIQVEVLPPPTLAVLGLPAAAAALGPDLWPGPASAQLDALLARLPASVPEPTLQELQKTLLLAPGPRLGGSRSSFLIRVERLLAMAEAQAALDLLGLVPADSESDEIADLRLRALFAADRVEEACAMAQAGDAPRSPWAEARIVCAALTADTAAVELGLEVLVERSLPASPSLATLARAVATGQRVAIDEVLPDEPVLLPLLRRAPLDLDAALAARQPRPVRAALASNQGLASAVREAATPPPRPGPSIRPELNGAAPASWEGALAGVPADRREAYLALVDGLGLTPPEAVWTAALAAEAEEHGPAPDLVLWRGMERAAAAGRRGEALLYLLLLLDGQPEEASPLLLNRGLRALRDLGREREARALAAATGGALGL